LPFPPPRWPLVGLPAAAPTRLGSRACVPEISVNSAFFENLDSHQRPRSVPSTSVFFFPPCCHPGLQSPFFRIPLCRAHRTRAPRTLLRSHGSPPPPDTVHAFLSTIAMRVHWQGPTDPEPAHHPIPSIASGPEFTRAAAVGPPSSLRRPLSPRGNPRGPFFHRGCLGPERLDPQRTACFTFFGRVFAVRAG